MLAAVPLILAVFVDPFGTLDELRAAVALIPAPTTIVEVSGVGHDLGARKGTKVLEVAPLAVDAALSFGLTP